MIDKKFYWLDTRTLAVILRPMDRVEFRFLRHSCGKRDAGAYFPTLGMPERLIRLNHLQRGKRLQLDLPVCIINTWDWLRQTNSVSNRTTISIAGAFNYLSVLNLNSSWTFKDIYGYSGNFSPRFTRRRTDLHFIYCAQSRKQNIVQPYKFSKIIEKIRRYGEKFRICLEMIRR